VAVAVVVQTPVNLAVAAVAVALDSQLLSAP